MCTFVSDLSYIVINTIKETNLSRRFFGLDRFTVLINVFINVVCGGAINTIINSVYWGFGSHPIYSYSFEFVKSYSALLNHLDLYAVFFKFQSSFNTYKCIKILHTSFK